MKALPINTTHDLFECPACGQIIQAQVTIEPNLGSPRISADRRASVPINPQIERFAVSHSCSGRPDHTHAADMTPAGSQETE